MHVDNQFPPFPQNNLNIWIPKLHDWTLPSSSKKTLPIFMITPLGIFIYVPHQNPEITPKMTILTSPRALL